EVLDATTVEWIKDNGGLTRANGDRFRQTLLSQGGSKDAMELFRDFTGQEPDINALLVRRGLDAPVSDDSAVPGGQEATPPQGCSRRLQVTRPPGAIRAAFLFLPFPRSFSLLPSPFSLLPSPARGRRCPTGG